jgi:hypothetical protein
MTKEFIPYEQALALKELGFDETCFASINNFSKIPYIPSKGGKYINSKDFEKGNTAACPLYQQVFRWFREKFVLDSIVQPTYSTKYQFRVFNVETKFKVQVYGDYMSKEFNTYEEAELECLNKLIEIVKTKHYGTRI